MYRFLAATIAVGSLVAGCASDKEGQEAPNPPIATPSVSAQPDFDQPESGSGPPQYEQPVLLVPGDYKPPSASSEAQQKWEAGLAEWKSHPQFNGTLNGFRLYGWEHEEQDPGVGQKECVSVTFEEVSVFETTYLLPGTLALGPQYAGICEDGSTAWVARDFTHQYGTFSVGYELGEKAIGNDATEERVSAITVVGRPGLLIAPQTEEGNGQSVVAYALDKGFIIVGATGLPADETIKIAEGVECPGC
jgi:hypothetical protein